MRYIVHNKQQYALGRGGFIFAPGVDTEVSVESRVKLREITACVYLDVRPVSNEPAGKQIADVEIKLEQALDALTVPQLKERASELGFELPSRANKPELITAFIAEAQKAAQEIEGVELDSAPYDEWLTEALVDLLDGWGVEIPEGASRGDILELVEGEHKRQAAAEETE